MDLFLQIFMTVAVPVLITILTTLVNRILDYQIQKIQNEKVQQLLREGTALILDSVNYIQQTYVDDLKATGSFDAAAQRHALDAAKTRALDLMRNDVYRVLDSQYENVNKYIETIIESAIAQKKEKS